MQRACGSALPRGRLHEALDTVANWPSTRPESPIELAIRESGMTKRKFAPVHPGVVLADDFLRGKNISQCRLAKGIGVPARRIKEIVQGKRGITAETALRLGKFFGIEPQFWMNLQSHYDLEVAKDAIAGKPPTFAHTLPLARE